MRNPAEERLRGVIVAIVGKITWNRDPPARHFFFEPEPFFARFFLVGW